MDEVRKEARRVHKATVFYPVGGGSWESAPAGFDLSEIVSILGHPEKGPLYQARITFRDGRTLDVRLSRIDLDSFVDAFADYLGPDLSQPWQPEPIQPSGYLNLASPAPYQTVNVVTGFRLENGQIEYEQRTITGPFTVEG